MKTNEKENQNMKKRHHPPALENGSFGTNLEKMQNEHGEEAAHQVENFKAQISSTDLVFWIFASAKKQFRFCGGRKPAMTLAENSNTFYDIEGRDVRLWVVQQFGDAEAIPRAEFKQAVIDFLAAHAIKKGGPEPRYRICQERGRLYYQLHDNHIIRISAGKVKRLNRAKGRAFWYSENDEEQVQPDLTVGPDQFFRLLEQAFHVDDNYRLAFAAVLLGFFVPDLKTPVLVLSGEKGTAKTTTSKHLIDIVSPTRTQAVVSFPTREDALMAKLSNTYITAFDNLQFPIKPHFSDVLCQAVTHGSISKRKLYSTNDVAVYDLRSKLILNGIDEIAARPDFAERCCVVYLEPIPEDKRRTDREIEEDFKALKPKLLGAIFNALRHTQMCAMIELGIAPAVAAARLGDTITTAMTAYSHSSRPKEQAAAALLEKALSR